MASPFEVVILVGVLLSPVIVEGNVFTCPDKTRCSVCSDTQLSCVRVCNKLPCVEEFNVLDFSKLRKDLVDITVTGNNFTSKLPVNLFGNCSVDLDVHLQNLRHLNLSMNNITRFHGKTFHCITGLETLDLSHNNWHVDNHTHVFSSLPKLKKLFLENTFYERPNGTKHLEKLAWYINVTGMSQLTHLNLASNEFWSIPLGTQQAFCQLENLQMLNLSRNMLQSPNLCGEMDKLQILDLSHNHLPWLSEELMENLNEMKVLKRLYLHENIFQCDCGMIPFYKWLKNDTLSRHVQNRQNLTCVLAYNTVHEGQSIMSLQLSDLKCPDHVAIYNASGVVIGLFFIVIAGLFVAALYYKRNSLKMAWRSFFSKPVKLSLIPQSQGYATVHNQSM